MAIGRLDSEEGDRGGFLIDSMPCRGTAIDSLRQRGHRLGHVNLVRPRKTYAQSWHEGGSRTKRREESRFSVLTTWTKCSSICRSGRPTRSASCLVVSRVSARSSRSCWRAVCCGGGTMHYRTPCSPRRRAECDGRSEVRADGGVDRGLRTRRSFRRGRVPGYSGCRATTGEEEVSRVCSRC